MPYFAYCISNTHILQFPSMKLFAIFNRHPFLPLSLHGQLLLSVPNATVHGQRFQNFLEKANESQTNLTFLSLKNSSETIIHKTFIVFFGLKLSNIFIISILMTRR